MILRTRSVTARRLRRDATDAEKAPWRALRERFPAWRFRRQHPIGGRIADFACPSAKVVVELDGGQHARQESEDTVRTAELARHGYRVIRFWNNDVLGNLEGVLASIVRELGERPTSPRASPPPGAERGQGGVMLADLLSRFDPEKHRHPLMLDAPRIGIETL